MVKIPQEIWKMKMKIMVQQTWKADERVNV